MGDSDDAEDVVQDVLLRLWQIRDELHLPLRPLAMCLVRNRCIDLIRRRRGTDELKDDIADEPTIDDDRYKRVMMIIDTLPTMQQMVVRMRHIEGMEMKEIAGITGTTEVAVRKTLSRARQAIRNRYLKTE